MDEQPLHVKAKQHDGPAVAECPRCAILRVVEPDEVGLVLRCLCGQAFVVVEVVREGELFG